MARRLYTQLLKSFTNDLLISRFVYNYAKIPSASLFLSPCGGIKEPLGLYTQGFLFFSKLRRYDGPTDL